jgi:hypothetical protein
MPDPIAVDDSFEPAESVPLWLKIVVTGSALLLGAGGILALFYPALMVGPQAVIDGATRIYAGYMASRNLALAVMLLALLGLGARRALGQTMILVALIQAFDLCIDCFEARWTIVPGVFVFGMVALIAGYNLIGSSVFRRRAGAA